MQPVPLFELPHPRARALCATGAPVYLAINPVEYHGPHLSLYNDGLISAALCRDLHARLATRSGEPFLLASSIDAGVEPCPGPGTRATPFPALVDLVLRSCEALADLGAKRVVLMTFHGAPLHSIALDAGVKLLAARGVRALAPLNLLMAELLKLDGNGFADAFAPIEDPAERAQVMGDLPLDFHAGFFETSMALHYVPESVAPSYRELAPCPAFEAQPSVARLARLADRAGRRDLARELRLVAFGLGWAALRPFPGYTGRPHLARADVGERFATEIVERYAEAAQAVFDGAPPPPPIMRWLPTLSLGGRIRGLHVPLGEVAQAPG